MVTVCSLWAMVSTVQPLNSVRRVSWVHRLVICSKWVDYVDVTWIHESVLLSTAAVASSNTNTFDLLH